MAVYRGKNTASIALAGKLGFMLYGSSVYDTGNKGAQQCYLYKKSCNIHLSA